MYTTQGQCDSDSVALTASYLDTPVDGDNWSSDMLSEIIDTYTVYI